MNKKRLSYSGKKVFIGIDVHRSFYVISAVCEGQDIKTTRIPAENRQVVKSIQKLFPEATIETCYEAGFSGFGLHRELEKAGIVNLVVHAASVEISARDRVKTDKRDSRKLAIQLQSQRLRSIRVPSEKEEQLRLLTRTREQLVRAISRTRNQIRMKLHQFGLIDPLDHRVLTRSMVQKIMEKELPEELNLTINALLESWKGMSLQKYRLERELRNRALTSEIIQTWLTLPGIGAISSSILAFELGDMSQFPNERALFSYTGLTPGEYSSGEKVYRGHISRQGSAQLRHTLTEAAWRSLRKDVALKEDFERIAARRGKKRAIVAIARKLVGRARAVFRKQEGYELGYHKAA